MITNVPNAERIELFVDEYQIVRDTNYCLKRLLSRMYIKQYEASFESFFSLQCVDLKAYIIWVVEWKTIIRIGKLVE